VDRTAILGLRVVARSPAARLSRRRQRLPLKSARRIDHRTPARAWRDMRRARRGGMLCSRAAVALAAWLIGALLFHLFGMASRLFLSFSGMASRASPLRPRLYSHARCWHRHGDLSISQKNWRAFSCVHMALPRSI